MPLRLHPFTNYYSPFTFAYPALAASFMKFSCALNNLA